LTVVRTDYNYPLLSWYNFWQTSWKDYLLNGDIAVENYVHLFDFGIASTNRLYYGMVDDIIFLKVIETTNSTIKVSFAAESGVSMAFTILIKPAL
jgi:hypothetical protein